MLKYSDVVDVLLLFAFPCNSLFLWQLALWHFLPNQYHCWTSDLFSKYFHFQFHCDLFSFSVSIYLMLVGTWQFSMLIEAMVTFIREHHLKMKCNLKHVLYLLLIFYLFVENWGISNVFIRHVLNIIICDLLLESQTKSTTAFSYFSLHIRKESISEILTYRDIFLIPSYQFIHLRN